LQGCGEVHDEKLKRRKRRKRRKSRKHAQTKTTRKSGKKKENSAMSGFKTKEQGTTTPNIPDAVCHWRRIAVGSIGCVVE